LSVREREREKKKRLICELTHFEFVGSSERSAAHGLFCTVPVAVLARKAAYGSMIEMAIMLRRKS
jgi:hypothetical protein